MALCELLGVPNKFNAPPPGQEGLQQPPPPAVPVVSDAEGISQEGAATEKAETMNAGVKRARPDSNDGDGEAVVAQGSEMSDAEALRLAREEAMRALDEA